jgi:aminodeoxyfutalosine deaminase
MYSLDTFIAALPKVELHLHLVGSASVPTVLELARRHPDSPVPRSEEGLREFYEFRDFPHISEVYGLVSQLVTEPPPSPPALAGPLMIGDRYLQRKGG